MNARAILRMLWVPAVGLAGAAAGCSGGGSAPNDGSACMNVDPPATCPSTPPSYKNEISFVVANYCAEPMCHGSAAGVSVHDFTTYQGIFDDHLTFARDAAFCPSSAMGMPPAGYPQPTNAQRLDLVTWAGICKAPNN